MSVDRPRMAALALAASLTFASPAHALLCGTVLDPIGVSATALNFGTYTATNPADTTASGTVTVSCGLLGVDLLPDFTVSLSAGNGGGFAPRRMANGADMLSYNLYTDAALTTVWGDGTGGTGVNGFSQALLHLGTYDFTAYGALPAGQFVKAGTYSDTIVVTVTY